MGKSYLHSLTPLRGVAALMVVVYHYQVLVYQVVDTNQSWIVNKWYLLVDFFFILSGFIITYVYQDKFKDGFNLKAFKKFMMARFARLYPLHILTLLLMLGLFGIAQSANLFERLPDFVKIWMDTDALPAHLLLVQALGFFSEPTWNAPSWSISTEWWAYITFPMLIYVLTKYKKIARPVYFLMAIAGMLSIMFYFQPAQYATRLTYMGELSELPNTLDVMVGSAMLRCLCGFILGMLVYKAFEQKTGVKILSNSWLLLGLIVVLFTGWHLNIMPDIISALIFGFIILMAIYNNGFFKKLLAFRGFQFVGEISYSLYMVHIPIIFSFYILRTYWQSQAAVSSTIDASTDSNFLAPEMADYSIWIAWGGLFVFVASTIFVSYLTYTFFENPVRKYIRKLEARSNEKHAKEKKSRAVKKGLRAKNTRA